MMKRYVFLVLILSVVSSFIYADKINLTNGKTIEFSEIFSVDEQGISFHTQSGIAHFKWELIPDRLKEKYRKDYARGIAKREKVEAKKKAKEDRLRIEKEKKQALLTNKKNKKLVLYKGHWYVENSELLKDYKDIMTIFERPLPPQINKDNYTSVLWLMQYDADKKIKAFHKKYPEYEYFDELEKLLTKVKLHYKKAENAGKASGIEAGIIYEGKTKLDGRLLRRVCQELFGKARGVSNITLEGTNMKMYVTKQMYQQIQVQERKESDQLFKACIKRLLPEKKYKDIVIEVEYAKRMVITGFIDKYSMEIEVLYLD